MSTIIAGGYLFGGDVVILKASKSKSNAADMVLLLYGPRYDRQFLSCVVQVNRHNAEVRHFVKTCGSAARPVLVSRASRSALASYRKVTTCRYSLLVLCMPGVCYICRQFVSAVAGRPCIAATGRRQTAGCLDSYLIPQITAARPEAGNARRSVAVVHKPRPTVNICSPDTTVAYVCASTGWLRGHVSGKGANVEYQLR